MARNIFATKQATPRNLFPTGKKETFEEQALRLGAKPGVALTPGQIESIKRGVTIDANEPQLIMSNYRPKLDDTENAFIASAKQEMKNIGAGIISTFAQIGNELGYDNARRLLDELETSQKMDLATTEKNVEGHPVQSFAGGVAGGTLALPVGGFGGGLLTRILTGSASGALGGALSATGRGEEGADIAQEATIGGVFGAAGEAAPKLIGAVKAKRAAKELDQVSVDAENISDLISNIETAKEASKQTGIKLLPAQSTLDPFQKEMTAFLGQNPEISKKALKTLSQQNKQASDAVSNLLNTIATPDQFSSSPGMGRSAAKKIIQASVDARSKATKPLYDAAFRKAKEQGFKVNRAEVDKIIADALDELPDGKIKNNVLKAKRSIGDTTELRKLHFALQEISEQLETGVKDGAIGNNSKRYLTQIRQSLSDALTEFEPFKVAQSKYAELSPDVDKVKEGVFGRIASLSDKELKRVSSIIFDPTEINSKETVRNAVKALKGVDGGEDVARGLLRVELEKRMSKLPDALDEMQLTDDMKNAPASLKRAIFGNAKQQEMLFSALDEIDPKYSKNALWLKTALDRAMQARPGGSQTGVRNLITQELRGAGLAVWNFFRRPIASLGEIGEEAAFNRKVRAVGEALYNPDWQPDINKLKKLDPLSAKTQSEFEKLLTKIVKTTEGARTQAAAVSGRTANQEDQQ